ncbi:hypothetical protein I5677_14180 [Mobilitalea sibirica]|uniref:glutamine--fructose-6-phosphate transaminase (isomerizing) n=1 Tax=Mobilitalea sibirica TaxID=1462919 RepID=A0A8J7H480_9FIRM|nr:hypothetical protein [Mobilitalea sibirica]MBH1942045.1 hypothetical protein [Mobilitalea sibirica]
MCGIFGVIINSKATNLNNIENIIKDLVEFSQSRGRDSSGLMLYDKELNEYNIYKGSMSIKQLTKNSKLKKSIKDYIHKSWENESELFIMGHSRLVTNGSQISQHNNQPVIRNNMIAIHNGIIVNDNEIWKRHSDYTRYYEVDTESYLALLNDLYGTDLDITSTIDKIYSEIEGTVSLATVISKSKSLLLHSNNGSLYLMTDLQNVLIFASENNTLKRIYEKYDFDNKEKIQIFQLNKGSFGLCDYADMTITVHENINPLTNTLEFKRYNDNVTINVNEIQKKSKEELDLVPSIPTVVNSSENVKLSKMLQYDRDNAINIKRCTKCLLPSTFPFIRFDDHGECNYCHNYKIKNKPKKLDELIDLIEPYRRKDGKPDCIVPFSGGRDSTYALHLIKNELNLNPIAYTYDWGMVTDLGRRNIARVCGKLEVENIIVAADIRKKRQNIKKNLSAWLRKPHLGMLPILMAGDKYFYYYVEKIKRETGIKLNIWGVNPMENTDFKVGFVGVSPDFEKKYIYSLSIGRKFKLISSMGKIVASNPAYINSSVFDTLGSFVSRSILPHNDYFHLFDYYKWDEHEIDDLISNEYNWEKAVDTSTTWRIGDGTAAFYNYVYFTVAGFSEHDAFRSNQIREGVITREEALKLVIEENRPRHATIKWYLDTVGMDYEQVISIVNQIPKLYKNREE